MPENSTKILSVYNRLQAGDYENGNGSKRRVSRLTQFINATLQLLFFISPMTYMGDSGSFQADSPSL